MVISALVAVDLAIESQVLRNPVTAEKETSNESALNKPQTTTNPLLTPYNPVLQEVLRFLCCTFEPTNGPGESRRKGVGAGLSTPGSHTGVRSS